MNTQQHEKDIGTTQKEQSEINNGISEKLYCKE